MVNEPKIALRVEAGNIIGTGHLMEIVSLLKSLRKRVDFCGKAIVNDHPFCFERLNPLVEEIEIVPEGVAGDRELDYLIPILKRERVSILVVDLTDRPVEYYRVLKEEIAKTFVILDNEIHTEIPATVVVNFSVTQSSQFYENACLYDTEYLIGPKYALLDEEIYDWAKRITFREEVKKIFVNQGGGDPFGLTAKTLKALEKLGIDQEIIVVVGGAMTSHHRHELEELKPFLKGNYRFYENIPQQMMYELLHKSDMALTTAGNTLYELAFFGVASIIIGHHERHDRVAGEFQEKGAAINLGIGVQIEEDDIAKVTESLLSDAGKRKTLSENARGLVDSYGISQLADRIVKEIKEKTSFDVR